MVVPSGRVRGRGGLPVALLALACACGSPRAPERPDWYDEGSGYDVEEPVAFTDAPYTFGSSPGFGELPMPPLYTTWFGEGDAAPDGCADWLPEPAPASLPVRITGMVTAHPRIYVKVNGCVPRDDNAVDSDEKYYGSYFVEDETGGVFVLGDSKVAHFDMGDAVTLEVRAVKNNFDLQMVAVHDVIAVDRGPYPIHYDVASDVLGPDDVGRVRRVTGVVADEPDTFGEFHVIGDDGQEWAVGLDVELNRRGVLYPVGTRVEVTAPVNYSYSTYTLVVMRIGQVTVLNG